MRGLFYIWLTTILFSSSCMPAAQVEKQATIPATRVTTVATTTPFLPTPTLINPASSTPERVNINEPILVHKYVFLSDYLTIHDLYFIDENNGWAVGELEWYDQSISTIRCCKPRIFSTSDGGASWNEIAVGITAGVLNSIIFTDPMTGYVVGVAFLDEAGLLILKTIDGGKSWKRVDGKKDSGVLNYVMATKQNEIWSVGELPDHSASLMLRSANGSQWKIHEHPTEIDAELTALAFTSEKVGYSIGFVGHDSPDSLILKTTDGGDSWAKLQIPHNTGRFLDMIFLDNVTGYIVGHYGDTGSIAITRDGGQTWIIKYLHAGLWANWISESRNRLIVFGNCIDSDSCDNLIGLFDGKELLPFETLTFAQKTFTAVGNIMKDGSITFVTNAKPETWDAKYETIFYRYNVP